MGIPGPPPLCMKPWCPFPAVFPVNPNLFIGDGLAIAIVTAMLGCRWTVVVLWYARSPGICIALSKLENLHIDWCLLVCF